MEKPTPFFQNTLQCPENIMKVSKGLLTSVCRAGTQLAFTCSKSIVETLEKDVKYVQG